MPPKASTLTLCLLTPFAILACQKIAGVEDKQLDPALSGKPDAAADVSQDVPVDVADEAVHDAPDDVVQDAGLEADPLFPPRPPDRPDGGIPEAGPDAAVGRVLTFAVRRFFFGSIDPATDVRTYEAWRQFGFDVDGFCTTAKQSQENMSGVCIRSTQAIGLAQEDGFGCRDNTVGHVFADALLFSVNDFERTVHARTQSGDAQTFIIQLLDVGDGPDDPYVPARVYVTAPTQFPPLWDGNDVLPVDEESVEGSVDQPKYVIDEGYIRDGVWVSGDFNASPTVMPVMLFDEVAEVNADTATFVIRLEAGNTSAQHGMLGVVLDTAQLVPLIERGVLEATNCNQALADIAVNGYFLPSRDLVAGAPDFVDPTVACDRQSFGMLLDLKPVLPPVEAVPVAPQPSACD